LSREFWPFRCTLPACRSDGVSAALSTHQGTCMNEAMLQLAA
jgi:hypothetical protein